jgi:hypothetical protein
MFILCDTHNEYKSSWLTLVLPLNPPHTEVIGRCGSLEELDHIMVKRYEMGQ